MPKFFKIKNLFFFSWSFVVSLILIIAYQTYFIFFGLDTQYTFFHATRMAYNDPHVLAFLSYKIGYLWSLVFGKHILGFRVFNMLLYIVMLLCPLYLLKKKKKNWNTYVLLILANIFFALMNWNILGYDSFSFLSSVITTILIIKYLKKSSFKSLVLVGVSMALSIAFRFPNVVLIPIFILILFYQYFFIFICSLILFYYALVFVSFDTFFMYKQELLKALFDTNEQHAISKLVSTYINHFVKIMCYSAVIIVFYLLYIYTRQTRYQTILYVMLAVLGGYLYYVYIYGSGYNARASMFMGSLILSVIALHFFNSYKKEKRLMFNTFLVIALLLFVPSMGSKSGLKYSGVFIVFLPYALHYAEFKTRSFFTFALFILLPFAVKERFSVKFMDKNHNQLTASYKQPKVDNILTTQARVRLLDSITRDYDKYKRFGYEIIFYGLNSYLYNYVLRADKIPFKTYRMDINHKKETQLALSMITEKNKPVFFIVSTQIKPNTNSLLEKEIIRKSYLKEEKRGYSILYPR